MTDLYKTVTRHLQTAVSSLELSQFNSEKERRQYLLQKLRSHVAHFGDFLLEKYKNNIVFTKNCNSNGVEARLTLVVCTPEEFTQLVNEAVEAKLEAEYG